MKYTIKVWIFTTILSPILIIISQLLIYFEQWPDIAESSPMLLIMILFGLVLSIPAMILFGIILYKFTKLLTTIKKKLILSFYSFASVWITFYIFDKGFIEEDSNQLIWVIIYSVTIVIGIWIFKLKKDDNTKIDNQNQG